MNPENVLLSIIAALVVVIACCLGSVWLDRRKHRQTSIFHSHDFRSAHVQPTEKPAPTVATIRRSLSAPTVDESLVEVLPSKSSVLRDPHGEYGGSPVDFKHDGSPSNHERQLAFYRQTNHLMF